MANLINGIQNSALASITQHASANVVNAIQGASAKTGVNFAYLVQQASAESNFEPSAKAKTSSATGLYQFIERTWLDIVDKYGDKHGIDTSDKSRSEILNMRKDPDKASLMAAELAGENERYLERHTSVDIGSTELYFAHFLGAGKAAAFLNARQDNPLQAAADIFPRAAAANKGVFYDRSTGRAKSMEEVYAFFDKKFGIEDSGAANVQIASAPIPPSKPQPQAQPQAQQAVANLSNSLFGAQNNAFASASNSVLYRNASNPFGVFNLANPVEISLLADLDLPGLALENRENRLHSANRAYNQ